MKRKGTRRIGVWILAALLLACTENALATAQTGARSAPPARPAPVTRVHTAPFIVAFDVVPGKEFTWPMESMRPASYEAVRLVVEMPWAVDARSRDGRLRPISALQFLKVNGKRLQRRLPASRAGDTSERYDVKLEGGRLRFFLLAPEGVRLDPQHRVARVRLYQTGVR